MNEIELANKIIEEMNKIQKKLSTIIVTMDAQQKAMEALEELEENGPVLEVVDDAYHAIKREYEAHESAEWFMRGKLRGYQKSLWHIGFNASRDIFSGTWTVEAI